MIVTTSWDDGYKLDLKLGQLLNRYNLKGTFYVAKNIDNKLSDSEIKLISQTQEIGSHTLTHPDLTKLSLEKARKEIEESKKWLEQIINKQLKMFCYPKGKYNNQIIKLVKQAEYFGARTTRLRKLSFSDNYQMPTTCNVFAPDNKIKRDKKNGLALWHRKLIRLQNELPRAFNAFFKLGLKWQDRNNWLEIAKKYFDLAYKKNGIFHLWGHSWEIEKYNLWREVEEIFRYISNREVEYLINSEVIKKQETRK